MIRYNAAVLYRIVALLSISGSAHPIILIHSFITDIYIAPLRGYYLEVLPISTRQKKNSFQAREGCVRMNSGEQSLHQWKSIPHGRANHRECTGLPCGSMGKSDKEDCRSVP